MLYQFARALDVVRVILTPIIKQNHLLVKTYPAME
jgi:hypothetical protein